MRNSMPSEPLYKNFDYIHGQILALHALILGLAQNIPAEVFRAQSLERLEAVRNHLLFSSREGTDIQRQGVDSCEEWIKTLTE